MNVCIFYHLFILTKKIILVKSKHKSRHSNTNDEFLNSKGYINNDALHLPTEDYNNKSVIARYLIGQFINCSGLGKIKMLSERYFGK